MYLNLQVHKVLSITHFLNDIFNKQYKKCAIRIVLKDPKKIVPISNVFMKFSERNGKWNGILTIWIICIDWYGSLAFKRFGTALWASQTTLKCAKEVTLLVWTAPFKTIICFGICWLICIIWCIITVTILIASIVGNWWWLRNWFTRLKNKTKTTTTKTFEN